MTVEEEGKVFADLISMDKYNQDNRLIYADWLEEHGFDDEALKQRQWTVEKQRAEDWIREEFVPHLGKHCENYDEAFAEFSRKRKESGLDWTVPEHREALDRLHDEYIESERHVDISYEMVMQAAKDYLGNKEGFCQEGSEQARNWMYSNPDKVNEFWRCYQIITGEEVKDFEGCFISCSC